MPTPWGTWITCEETTVGVDAGYKKPHGYVFEVDPAGERAGAHQAVQEARPVPARSRRGRPGHRRRLHDRGRGPRRLLPVRARARSGDLRRACCRCSASRASRSTTPSSARRSGRCSSATGSHRHPRPRRRRGQRVGGLQAGPGEGRRRSSWAARVAPTATAVSCSDRRDGGDAGLGQVWQYTPTNNIGKLNEEGELELLFESDLAPDASTARTTCARAPAARS